MMDTITDLTFWLLLAACFMILFSDDWRWLAGALGAIYLGVFILVLLSWPVELAAVKLLVGWMSALVLGMSMHPQSGTTPERGAVSARLFRVLAGGMAVLVVAALSSTLALWLPVSISLPVVRGSLLLIVMGLLQLGITGGRPAGVIVGLLVLLAGFEAIYAAVEQSLLLAGLLALVNLGLALVGSYLMQMAQAEKPA